MTRFVKSFCFAVGLVALASMSSSRVQALPVEYVKICSLYGTGFYYIPGTDACYNPQTGDTRQQTEGGTWRTWAASATPGRWTANPKAACTGESAGARVVKIGTFTSNDLGVNVYLKAETGLIPLKLGAGEFISSVMMTGGFDVGNRAAFCLSFYDETTGFRSTLGCHNTRTARDQPATWSFAPLRTVPPADFTGPYNLVAHNADENWGPAPSFDGEVSISMCVQNAGK